MLNLTIILIEPENEANLGSIVRLMKNFGVSKLIVINPKMDIHSNTVYTLAMHGKDLLQKLILLKKFSELPKFDYLIGTTARISGDHNVLRNCINPEELRENLKDFDGSIGILFGRDGSGLTNQEIEMCDCCVHIIASEDYPTLNLANACCIILYELYKLNLDSQPTPYRHANLMEKETLLKFFDLVSEDLHKIWGKFNEKRKLDAKRVFQNLIGRGFLSGRDAYTMSAVFRYIHLIIKEKD